ncbi:hypothetical protein HJG53_03470 [Sphingomonas sp. ID1715]|uniref:hypothetical protein n=1 Tax=Sphingomonas sp. ID1715 TaxID=1656898 RepID=UPI00148779E2|nr:hypothetical protein [Sphingomonas sp. ID1715]NNM75968.1 hypothetical protein [Sphingomonas sp. ID1715]
MSRNSAILLLLALPACDAGTVTNRSERSGDVKVTGVTEIGNNSSAALQGVGAPMAWRVVNGAAFYGSADQPAAFALRCDRGAQQIVVERPGSGGTITLSAAGVTTSLGTRTVDNDRVQARIGIADAVITAMAHGQSEIVVTGAGAAPLTLTGGVAIRRVVDFCAQPLEASPTPETGPSPLVIPQTIDEPAPTPAPTPMPKS